MTEIREQCEKHNSCIKHGLYPCPHHCFGKIISSDENGHEIIGYGDRFAHAQAIIKKDEEEL